MRFRKVPAEGSGAEVRSFSGRFRCAYPGHVPEVSGAEVRCGSGEFRCRYLGEVPEGSGEDAEVRFRKIPMQRLGQVPEAVHVPRSGSGWCRYTGYG